MVGKRGKPPDLILQTSGGLIALSFKHLDVKAIRSRIGLSQAKFAARYGFGVEQVRAWEQGRNPPVAGNVAYLAAINADPEAVAVLLAQHKPPAKAKRRSAQARHEPL
jgi:transcriptional regulator with XRE-family HTH domain